MSGLSVVEHEGLWVVHKPAGIPCFPPHRSPDGDCVLRRLVEAGLPLSTGFPEGFEGDIAHRLDISTSGQLLVCQTPARLSSLRAAFEQKALRKRYLLWTRRKPRWPDNTVDRCIAHDRKRKARMIVQRGAATPHRGKWLDAHTEFRTLGKAGEGWLVEALMSTGVMHQIRAHAGFVGIALAGDTLYGGGELGLDVPEGVRFLLHHMGLQGPGLRPPCQAPPSWWPTLGQASG